MRNIKLVQQGTFQGHCVDCGRSRAHRIIRIEGVHCSTCTTCGRVVQSKASPTAAILGRIPNLSEQELALLLLMEP